jgi:hypothetical protein
LKAEVTVAATDFLAEGVPFRKGSRSMIWRPIQNTEDRRPEPGESTGMERSSLSTAIEAG